MSTLIDLRNVRLGKLEDLRKLGVDPYPAKSQKNIDNADVLAKYSELEGTEVVVAGRVVSLRSHGKLVFADIKDWTGKVQLYIKEENLGGADYGNSELNFGDLRLLDEGDFIEGQGVVVETRRGEVSVEVKKLRILTKTLRPLPDSRKGLKDKETRLRRRYVDTNVNEDVYERFLRRSRFWEAHREFFDEHGFVEMNIPVLEHIPGGGEAHPFVTHMDSVDEDFYLRISQELYLKRLVGGGYEKVYEIGPRFRNEGLSDEHLPEHMAMEFYWAYADWEDGMEFIRNLYSHILEKVYGGREKFKIRGFDVDFSKDWDVVDFGKVMKDKYDLDVYSAGLDEVQEVLSAAGIERNFALNVPRGIDNLWKRLRREIAGPAFLINHPKCLSPLQKASVENADMVERFQPIIAGSEVGNGWSEVTDAVDQFGRFNEQQKMRDEGDKEAQWLDIDYVEMLEYGMPPTFGFGHSERVFWFLEDVPAREGVPFPQLRYELDESTKKIYKLEN